MNIGGISFKIDDNLVIQKPTVVKSKLLSKLNVPVLDSN
jgi:hypothetical protein